MYNKFAKQVVAETLVWIEENLTEPLSIEAIGAQSGYSPWHFQRMFKYFTGVTLGKYIRMRRLTRAMMELKYSTKKIADIAVDYNFQCNASFTKFFTQNTGVPPSQYRKSPRFFNRSFTPPISLYHPVELKTPVIIQREAICCRGDNDILNCDASIGEQDYLRFSRQIQRDYLHKYGEYARLAVTHVRSNQSKHYISFDKYVGTGVSQPVSGRNTALLPAGNYARFIYQGDGRNYFYFLMQAHAYLLNEMHFRKIGEYFIESIVAMSHQDTEVPEFTLHLDIPVYDDGLPQEDKQPRWLAPASPRDLTSSAVMEGA